MSKMIWFEWSVAVVKLEKAVVLDLDFLKRELQEVQRGPNKSSGIFVNAGIFSQVFCPNMNLGLL